MEALTNIRADRSLVKVTPTHQHPDHRALQSGPLGGRVGARRARLSSGEALLAMDDVARGVLTKGIEGGGRA
jgi:hypothetical protein